MTTAFLYALGVALFVLGLALSIALHEAGHFLTAKLFGARVTEFFIGFGSKIWSRVRGETEYGFKSVPLGGYVKIVGMLPPGPDQAEGTVPETNTGMFTQMISDARKAEFEIVRPGEEDRLFYRLPWWKKVVVMGSGATVNLVLAFLLLGSVFMIHGVPTATLTISQVSDCVVPATEANRACTASDPVAPAKLAGLQAGDTITTFDGAPVTSWDQLTELIRANGDKEVTIGFLRGGQAMTTSTKTVVSVRPAVTSSGTIQPDQYVDVGFLGILTQTGMVRQGPGYVLRTMGDYTVSTAQALTRLPSGVYHATLALVGVEKRDPNGPISVVGAGRIAGEVTSQPHAPLSNGLWFIVFLLGAVNLFIGMLNFVPLPPLDGGHLAGALFEGARRGWARLRHRPDPGFVDVAQMIPAAYAIAMVFIVVSAVLVLADLIVPVHLG
jgi:membrane-associated protease RseP (regulator of RpoE activity)